MNEEKECIHVPGMPASQCTLCNGKDKKEIVVPEEPIRISARFEGRCKECGFIIMEGQECMWFPDQHFVKHVECL